MCRLACIYKPSKIVDKESLLSLFSHLEKSAGGHGNGVGGWVKGEPFIVKGVEMTVDECLKVVTETKWDNDICLFHSRIVSKGLKRDDNCHPFAYGDYITCHNGTTTPALKHFVPDMIELIKMRDTHISDSEGVSYLIGKYGFDVLKNELVDPDFSGVFLSLDKDGLLHIFKSDANKDLEIIHTKKGTIVASEFEKTRYSVDTIKEVPSKDLINLSDVMASFDKLDKATVPVVTKSTYYSNRKYVKAVDQEDVIEALKSVENKVSGLVNSFFYALKEATAE